MGTDSWDFEKLSPPSDGASVTSPARNGSPGEHDPTGSMPALTPPGGRPPSSPPTTGTPPSTPPATPMARGAFPSGFRAVSASPSPTAGPPVRHRPSANPSRPLAPPPVAPSVGGPRPTPRPAPVASPGWGWRALIAFLAGGVLTAGGFTVGQLATDDGGSTAAIETTVAPVTAPAPPTTIPAPSRPIDPEAEPAAFVAQELGPSVVQIETNFGIGSGVIYGDGLILTNHHVVDGALSLTVQLSDGRRLTGEILGSEPNVDIAVVSVGPGQDLPIAPLATGEKPKVGQIAIAIGSPFRLQQTVTEGIVSAVDRPVPTGRVYTAMIQTDAPINPGNSGGALADRDGRVIGINTAIQTDGSSSTNVGVGFAIPIDTALSVAERLVAGEPIEAGFLGVSGSQSTDGSAGVLVTEVTVGSAAEAAGIVVGDLIISIDGAPVTEFEELAGLVVANSPGDVVVLELVAADGSSRTVEATLGAR